LEKNGGAYKMSRLARSIGGKVKNAGNMLVFVALVFLGAGVFLTGCKSAPELTKVQAQALIQAKYDQAPTVGANIVVDLQGIMRGGTAKYWVRSKAYPNQYWADFTLTPEGKKVIALPKGGDVIEWHPENAGDKNYTVAVTTVAANHLKAHDLGEPQDEVGGTKSVTYVESVSLDGTPKDLQVIAGGPGNKLSGTHLATFALDGGAWKLQSTN
jgi:hypothetical protein